MTASFLPFPDAVRFVRRPREESIEVEFLMDGEMQGRIFDVEVLEIRDWLRLRGIRMTYTLDQALDAVWNLGHVLYVPSLDRLLVQEMEED